MFHTLVLALSLAGFDGGVTGQPAAESCSSCHAGLEKSALREPATARKDVHVAAGLGCVACHGGDPTARDASAAHGKSFLAQPASSAAAVALCAKCHQKPAESYLKGPHHLAKDVPKKPNCVTCHGSHGIQPASIDLIGEPLCVSCHTYPQAGRIHKALFDAERDVALLDKDLKAAGGEDAARALIKDARSQLRGHAHALDLLAITRSAAQVEATIDEVRAKELPKLKARSFGRAARTAGLVIAALFGLIALGGAARFVWTRWRHIPLLGNLGPREWKVIGVAGGVLAIAGGVVAWRGQQYVEHDPKFCLSCHNMTSAYDLWGQSGHKNVECHACHVPNTVNNLRQLYIYTTERPEGVSSHAQVPREICNSCHDTTGKSPSKLTNVAETPGHRVHAGKQRIECIICHSMSVHRFKPPKEVCATCHKQITLAAAGTMAEMHCMQCHPFMAADSKRPLRPDRTACLDCHEKRSVKGEVFPAAKAPMKWDCGKCHKPHERINLANSDCQKCHDAITEGLHSVKAHVDDCKACHKPHTWTSGSEGCVSCHKRIQPAKHHPGKGCVECHGAWDDQWVKLAQK
jgi:hypothetical protein